MPFAAASLRRNLLLQRQANQKRRPPAGFAVNGDAAVVLLDDLMDDEESETGALADVLGREKWIEDLREEFKGDADTVVSDFDVDGVLLERALAAVLEVVVDADFLVLDVVHGPALLRLDRHRALIRRDGVDGVLDQVQKHLLHALLVREDDDVVGNGKRNRNLRRYLSLDELYCLFDYFPERQRFFLEFPVPRKIQERPDDVARTVGLVVDLGQHFHDESGVRGPGFGGRSKTGGIAG